jgi:GNAT superfamily N-acetyltransferase
MEIRRLREQDHRSQFRSGDDDLDRFFRRFASQNQFRHYVGVTYVAAEQDRILGFVTVTPGHLEGDNLPAAFRRKLPSYPLPVLRLARLAVDAAIRGQGLGKQLIRFVIDLALKMAKDYGCTGIVVDAKSQAIDFYARYGFVELVAIEGGIGCQTGADADVSGDARDRLGKPVTTLKVTTAALALAARLPDDISPKVQCRALETL